MYTLHFGLREKPFQIAPSPKFLYPSETHDESRARILYGVEDSRGFVVVYGKVGLGKTTVLLSVLEELDAATRTALVYQPVPCFLDLLRMMAHEFGLSSEGRDEVNLMWDLNEFFIQRMAEGGKCVLIVDEAQNLSLDILEKLRTLSNLQTEEASLLQIVLVGQPELYVKLMDPRLLQLRQRVGVWHEIESLNAEETTDYILHRLQKAGARRPKDIIDPKTCRFVHSLTEGVPRVINQVCDTAMMICYGKESSKLQAADLEEAAHELHLDAVVGPEGVHKVPLKAPNQKPSRAWLRVAVVSLLIVLALGTAWILRDRLPLDLLSGDQVSQTTVPAEAVAGNLEREATEETAKLELPPEKAPPPREVQVEEASPVALASESSTEEASEHANCERMRERLAVVQKMRSEQNTVYTVHLHSFQEMRRARDFADDLCRGSDWDQPLFVEQIGSDPVWYRVLAGGFQNARAARTWIADLKQKQVTGYAQATRLDRGAQVLLPVEEQQAFAQQGVDG